MFFFTKIVDISYFVLIFFREPHTNYTDPVNEKSKTVADIVDETLMQLLTLRMNAYRG